MPTVIKDDQPITVATPLSAGPLAREAQGAQVVITAFSFVQPLPLHWWKLQLLGARTSNPSESTFAEARSTGSAGISLVGGLRRANLTSLLGSQKFYCWRHTCQLTLHPGEQWPNPTGCCLQAEAIAQPSADQAVIQGSTQMTREKGWLTSTGWVMLVQQIAESLPGNQCSLVSMNMKQETRIFCVHSHECIR